MNADTGFNCNGVDTALRWPFTGGSEESRRCEGWVTLLLIDWDWETGLLGERSATSEERGELEVEMERKEPSLSGLLWLWVKAGLGGRVSIGCDMNGLGPSLGLEVVLEREWEERR